MTDNEFKREIESAIEGLPKAAQLKTTSPSLDTGKLVEVARNRHEFALGELSRLNMEFQLERTRVLEDHRVAMEKLERDTRKRLHDLEAEYVEKMRPAKDMADLVSKLL